MAKFGCVSPSVAYLPWELRPLIPETVAVAVATLNVRNGRAGEFDRAIRDMRGATDVLVDEACAAIVVFGVPVSAKRGRSNEQRDLAALTADRGAVPIVSSLESTALGLRHVGAHRPLLITQYAEDVNAQVIAFYREAGLEPVTAVGLGARNAAEVNALKADDFYRLAREALEQHPSADSIFLSARGNLHEIARRLEAELPVPVVEQAAGAAWWACSELGLAATPNEGRLLATAPAQRVPS